MQSKSLNHFLLIELYRFPDFIFKILVTNKLDIYILLQKNLSNFWLLFSFSIWQLKTTQIITKQIIATLNINSDYNLLSCKAFHFKHL